MISVREEMGGAIQKYAEPITGPYVLSHQVQYLVCILKRATVFESIDLADIAYGNREPIGDSPIQCSHRANIYARYLFRTLSVRQ